MLDWAALDAVSVACSDGDFLSRRSRRNDDAAAVREYDVRAVGLGEAWRGLEEFLGVHEFGRRASVDCSRCAGSHGRSRAIGMTEVILFLYTDNTNSDQFV